MSHRKKSPQRDLRSHRSAPTPSAVCSVLRPCVRHSKRSRAAAFYAGRHFADPQVYADASDFFADLTLIFRQEIDSLGKAGCPYVQLDEVAIAMLCDPRLRERAKGEGGTPISSSTFTSTPPIRRWPGGRPICRMATTPHAGAHTELRFDRKIKSYSHRKRHYTFAKMTPRSKQNQWLISRQPARSVEDGLYMFDQLLDHLVGAAKQRDREGEASRLGSLA